MSIKIKAKRPPLSALDIALYCLFTLFGFAFSWVAIFLFGSRIPNWIAFSYADIIANDPSVEVELIAFLLALIGLLPFIVTIFAIGKRLPLFGNKHYKPKWSENVLNTPPLLSKNFFVQLNAKQKQRLIVIAIIAVTTVVLLAGALPFATLKRTTLDRQGMIVEYDLLGHPVHSVNVKDADQFVVSIRYSNRGGKNMDARIKYELCVEYVIDDEIYSFLDVDYAEMNGRELLTYLLELKAEYKNRFSTENAKYIGDLIHDNETLYNEEVKPLLYQLFDIEILNKKPTP